MSSLSHHGVTHDWQLVAVIRGAGEPYRVWECRRCARRRTVGRRHPPKPPVRRPRRRRIVRPLDCPQCVRVADRCAELIVQLKKTAHALHVAKGHRTGSFYVCPESPCREVTRLVTGQRDA